VDRQIVERLRQDDHLVLYVAEMQRGIPDDAVLASANEAGALLITTDKDFGELVFRRGLLSSGVILVRLAGLSAEQKAETVAAVARQHGAEFSGGLTVISPGTVRIRRAVT
jgi:predicted nuclease of predicted toxin-antitoxin system